MRRYSLAPRWQASLPTARCPLSSHCLPPTAYCLPPTAYRLLPPHPVNSSTNRAGRDLPDEFQSELKLARVSRPTRGEAGHRLDGIEDLAETGRGKVTFGKVKVRLVRHIEHFGAEFEALGLTQPEPP